MTSARGDIMCLANNDACLGGDSLAIARALAAPSRSFSLRGRDMAHGIYLPSRNVYANAEPSMAKAMVNIIFSAL